MMCNGENYQGRVSEELVLEGYRHWTSTIITGDQAHWRNASNMFISKLGRREGYLAFDALNLFTKALGVCAACPLKTRPIGCVSICKHEILILGLISGVQHGDDTAVTLCLDGLSCSQRCNEVLNAAEIFATTLRALDNILLPIPATTIKAIFISGSSTATIQ